MTTPLPDDALPSAGDERATVLGFLQYQRAVLARKAEGLTEEQARSATCPPSDLSMMGLIRHMADVERVWAKCRFRGDADAPLFFGAAHPDGDPDGDLHAPADAAMAEAFEAYWREIADADAIYAEADLDDIEVGGKREHNVRWILVHLVEEYARHCGHADLIRQAIDGATGD